MTNLLKVDEIYTALTTNSALMAKVTKIADIIPDGQASPYIQIGVMNEVHDVIDVGSQISLRLHIWSNYAGRKELFEIRELLKTALPSFCMVTDFETLQDSEEPNWWHGIMTIKYLI